MWLIFLESRQGPRNAPELIECILLTCFRCDQVLIIFQLNSNQRENLILKSSYMDFKLIYEFYALILFSAQR